MKNNRDILLSGFNLALWAALYLLGLISHERVFGLGLVVMAYFLIQWPKKSSLAVKFLFLAITMALFAYSLTALTSIGKEGLISGLVTVAFSLSYFFQWNGLRIGAFDLFSSRGEKIAAGLLSALVFGVFFSLFYPDFPSMDRAFVASLPERIQNFPVIITGALSYALLAFGVPNMGIVRRRRGNSR